MSVCFYWLEIFFVEKADKGRKSTNYWTFRGNRLSKFLKHGAVFAKTPERWHVGSLSKFLNHTANTSEKWHVGSRMGIKKARVFTRAPNFFQF